MTASVFLNGQFLPRDEAKIGIYDAGWLHGAGLFETMRAEQGCVFRLESHMNRLLNSAAKLWLTIDRRALPDRSVFDQLLEKNNLRTARIRLTVTAGTIQISSPTEIPPLSIALTATAIDDYPEDYYQKGVPVAICDFRTSPSDPLAGCKTTCYMPRLMGLRQAREKHCVEALWFTTANNLAEGCISNVFVIKDGVLRTPPTDTPVLPGIARDVVLETGASLGMETRQEALVIDDLLDADEVFLTNSIMQVLPVIRVEKRDIQDGKVGAITIKLRKAYQEIVRAECQQS